MTSLGACNLNLMNKLPILQPHLLSFPWVKRSNVRCFSTKASDPEKDFPVRYIPKKLRHVNQKQCFSPGDDAPRTNDKGLDKVQRHRGSRTDHQQSNGAFDDVHGMCKKTEKAGNRALKTRYLKSLQETVEHVIVLEVAVQELQISQRDGPSLQATLNQVNNNHNGVVNREYMENLASDVKEMQIYNVTGAKQKNSKICRTKQDAEKLAVQLLAKRVLTGVELRKKLTAKKFPIIVVEAVVRDFQNRGLINDRLYAEVYCSSRWKSSSWGPRKIKQELVKKGISEADVEKAVKLVFEDKNCDERSDKLLSHSSLQRLYEQSFKQWQRCINVPHDTRKARVIRWLQYRGFDWGAISSILKKLEAECP